MKKITKRLALVLCVVMLASVICACGKSKEDGGSKDILAGSWKQTDEMDGNWIWTFDGKGKCTLDGETTGFKSDGKYTLDESAGTITVNLDGWSDQKVFNYTLDGNTLDIKETYTSFHLIKQ